MTDLQFNAAEVLEKRLASSLGLDRYAEIMQKAKTTNISEDREFQHLFNAFYRVRRNEALAKNILLPVRGNEARVADF